jgi:hypothetical protein
MDNDFKDFKDSVLSRVILLLCLRWFGLPVEVAVLFLVLV